METMTAPPSAKGVPLVATNAGNVLMEYGATEVFLMDISVRSIKNGFLEAIIARDVKTRDSYHRLTIVLALHLNTASSYFTSKLNDYGKRNDVSPADMRLLYDCR